MELASEKCETPGVTCIHSYVEDEIYVGWRMGEMKEGFR
jgi:hypothetical protein